MARGREVPFEDKVAIKTLRESGHSFGGIAKKFGYSKSEAYKVLKTYQQLVLLQLGRN